MKVSIIIPVYNVAPYVEECIRSVMQQTLLEGVECIIVDDCGQDNSMEIVENILTNSGFSICENGALTSSQSSLTFSILHHDRNRGLSAARNTGINAAKGEYIYFLDSDDYITSECLDLMVECVRRHPDSEIVFAGAIATSGEHQWLDYIKKDLPEYSNDQDWLQLSMLRRFDFGMTAWNKLISRKFILDNNLRFVEGLVHEDEAWNFDLSKHIQSAAFLKHNTYIYNIHDNSIVTSASDDVRWERLFALWNVLLSKLNEEKKEMQIRAISACIIEKTGRKIPKQHRRPLCKLFYKLSAQAHGILSLLLFVQGTLALCLPSKHHNHYTCSRIKL